MSRFHFPVKLWEIRKKKLYYKIIYYKKIYKFLYQTFFSKMYISLFNLKKSARFAGTFSLRTLRAARFARKFERA